MSNYIQGNVYAITGGGSGLGQATALEIAKMGGKVAVMGRRLDKLQGTVDAITELGYGDNVLAFAGDVTKFEDNAAFVQKTVKKFGKMDVFFANAGVLPAGEFAQYEACLDAWTNAIDINIKGNLYGICASYNQFKEQGYGHFVTTSSIVGDMPCAGQAVYSASKMAIRYFAHALRIENPGLIKTSIICPPSVPETELLGVGAMLTNGTRPVYGQFTNREAAMGNLMKFKAGEDPELGNPDSIKQINLKLANMVESIMFVLNQPKGVCITEIKVHATNENLYL